MHCRNHFRLKTYSVTVLILFCFSALYAQETSTGSIIGKYINIYLYPASTLGSILVACVNGDQSEEQNQSEKDELHKEGKIYFTNLYATVEFLVSDPFTMTVTPSYQGWNFRGKGYDNEGRLNHDRTGSDFGFRYYTGGNPDGFFVQGTGGMYYFSRDIKYLNDPVPLARYRATLYQVMGYIGYVNNIGLCVSLGAGYNYYKDRSLSYRYNDEKKDLTKYLAQREFVFDFSISGRLGPVVRVQ